MLKQLVLTKQIEGLRSKLGALIAKDSDFESRSAALKTREAELEAAVNEVTDETTDEDKAVVDAAVAAFEADQSALDTEKGENETEKGRLEGEIKKLSDELEAINKKAATPPTEARKHERQVETDMEIREAINAYVKSKGQTRDASVGFTSVDGGALIPDELLAPYKVPEDVTDLTKIVRVVSVNRGAGKFPVIAKAGGKMVTVDELEANPELSKPTITEVPYDIETYRGYIPVSQEVIDDADYDVSGMIAEEISSQELNTKNAAIAAVLKTATAKAVTGLDGLKEIFNVTLSRAYTAKAVISASLFNELDTTKDLNGRYLLQDDITVASGKRVFGHEVVVLDDTMIGTAAGNLVGFIGDPAAFCALFDRKRASVKWVDNNVYGELLAGFVRFDVAKVDEAAGFYITYTPGE